MVGRRQVHSKTKKFPRFRNRIESRTTAISGWPDALFVEMVTKVINAMISDVDESEGYLSKKAALKMFLIDGMTPASDKGLATFYQQVKGGKDFILLLFAVMQDRELVSKLLTVIPAKDKSK